MTTIPSYLKSVNHYQGEARALLHLAEDGSLASAPPEGTFYQEKYDGSQFAFGLVTEEDMDDDITCRSKRKDIDPEKAGPFELGFDSVVRAHNTHGLIPGASYFGEFFRGKRQNQICYDRGPLGNIVLFDVRAANGTWLGPEELDKVADDLGMERCRWSRDYEEVRTWKESSLGGPLEGYVVKNYTNPVHGKNGLLLVKHVSDAFRESRGTKVKNPKGLSRADALFTDIAQRYSNPVRWQKVVQHLADDGGMDGSMKDMGKILKELSKDILEDHADDIREEVFKFAWKSMSRLLNRGVADWYQSYLQAQTDGFVYPHDPRAWSKDEAKDLD